MEACELRGKGRTPYLRLAERDCHVLEVAERLFLERGYHQVSLALIATSAGVATRTIYASFGDKRSLLEEVLERRSEAAALALSSLAGRDRKLGRQLHRLAAHVFEHALSPSLDLLHADLLAERCQRTPARRRWSFEGEWRSMLEQALGPANAGFADLFIACLMGEHIQAAPPCDGNDWSAGVIDTMALRVVDRFLELARPCALAEPFMASIRHMDKITS